LRRAAAAARRAGLRAAPAEARVLRLRRWLGPDLLAARDRARARGERPELRGGAPAGLRPHPRLRAPRRASEAIGCPVRVHQRHDHGLLRGGATPITGGDLGRDGVVLAVVAASGSTPTTSSSRRSSAPSRAASAQGGGGHAGHLDLDRERRRRLYRQARRSVQGARRGQLPRGHRCGAWIGVVRGVFHHNDVRYAFRDNAGGTACALYKSSVSGWTAVNLGRKISWTTAGAGAQINDGDVVTGATSGASGGHACDARDRDVGERYGETHLRERHRHVPERREPSGRRRHQGRVERRGPPSRSRRAAATSS
jgi:hypothetical protein